MVRHCNRDGLATVYDFGTLPVAEAVQVSLASLFAARCVPARWSAHSTSRSVWASVQLFSAFLGCLQPPVTSLDQVGAAEIKRWRLRLGAGPGAYNRHHHIAGLLGDHERFQAGPVAEELARRFPTTASKVQSYAQGDFERMRTVAQREFRAALLRIRENAAHLEAWRRGGLVEGSRDSRLGEALDVLARTGDIPRRTKPCGKLAVITRYRSALGGVGPALTWGRLFLSSQESAALAVLLLAEFGWNLSVIDTAQVPRALPDQGWDGYPVYRIPVEKFRRGAGQGYETRNVADDGAGSKGRLITEALEATRFARTLVEELAPGTDRLMVWRAGNRVPPKPSTSLDRLAPVGLLRFGVTSKAGAQWSAARGFGGSPFQRGRRTVVVIDKREPTQHTQDTHDRRYVLVDQRAQSSAADLVAAAAAGAADKARAVVVKARLVAAPVPGDVPVVLADCEDADSSPVPAAAGGCGASFLMCLGCGNAHVHPGHHPRLAHVHKSLSALRSAVPAAVWDADWAETHTRLDDLERKVGAAAWDAAHSRVTAADVDLVDLLLTGDLNP